MLIAIFDGRVAPSVADRLPGHDVQIFGARASTATEFVERARNAQVIGVRRMHGFELDRQVVEALPDLLYVHKSGTGTDWLDLPALSEHGILVSTNNGFNAPSVADQIVLLAQLCLRGTLEKLLQMKRGIVNRGTARAKHLRA